MTKHAIDNRANQLNPNNPAYHSSRSDAGDASESTSDGSKTTPGVDTKTQEAPPQGGEQK